MLLLLSIVGINVVICNYQQKQEHAQHVGENSQLHVSDHCRIGSL